MQNRVNAFKKRLKPSALIVNISMSSVMLGVSVSLSSLLLAVILLSSKGICVSLCVSDAIRVWSE